MVTVVLTRLLLASIGVLLLSGVAFVSDWNAVAGILFVLALGSAMILTFALLMISALREYDRNPPDLDVGRGLLEVWGPSAMACYRVVLSHTFSLSSKRVAN